MLQDDKIQLVQDSASNIWKVVREKTDSERFWSGLKISCICISLVRVDYALKNQRMTEFFCDIYTSIPVKLQWIYL